MRLPGPLAELQLGGLRVLTRLDDGSLGALFVLQPDGDVISKVTPAFLADAGAQARHAATIASKLAALRRLRMVIGTLVSVAFTTTSTGLAVLHTGIAAKLPLAGLLLVVLRRALQQRGRRSTKRLAEPRR